MRGLAYQRDGILSVALSGVVQKVDYLSTHGTEIVGKRNTDRVTPSGTPSHEINLI